MKCPATIVIIVIIAVTAAAYAGGNRGANKAADINISSERKITTNTFKSELNYFHLL
jgi:hypothetical protein